MKQIDRLKEDLQKCTCGMEMTGYLAGLEVGAVLWCKKNSPDDIYVTESGESKISICGMAAYLDSEEE